MIELALSLKTSHLGASPCAHHHRLQGYTPAQLALRTGGPSNPEHLYTKALLEDELSAFSRLDCSEYEQVLQEGPGHNGRSALVRAVARK
jgi:hypothetical protein